MSYQAIVIPAGTAAPYVATFGGGEDLDDLQDLQRIVGGQLQVVPTPNVPIAMWCNEDAQYDGLPVNAVATEFWASAGDGGGQDYLCGTVVLASYRSGLDGEDGDAASQLDPKWLVHFGLSDGPLQD